MTKIVPIPVPINGLNTVDKYIDLNSRQARELTNYVIVNGSLRVRPAIREEIQNQGVVLDWSHIWSNGTTFYGISKSAPGAIYNISAGTTGSNIGGSSQAHATRVKHVSLDLVIGCQAPRNYEQPFAAWSITTAVVTATAITSACSHKGRLYVSDGSTIEFSGLGQVAGSMASPTGGSFAVSEFMKGQSVLRMFSVTVQPGNNTESVLVIFGDAGRVLVYAGSYPNSANWGLIGDYDMPPPITRVGFVEVDGDIFVATTSYAYWFRDLFGGGSQTAYDNSPTRPIENLWVEYMGTLGASFPETSYALRVEISGDRNLDLILIHSSDLGENTWASYGNEGGFFCYHRKYKSWSIWLNAPFFYPIFSGSGYFGCNYSDGIQKLDTESLVDQQGNGDENNIETSWKTPYLDPFRGANQSLTGVRPYFTNSHDGLLHKIRAIADFTDYNTDYGFYTQSSVLPVLPESYADQSVDVASTSSLHYQPFVGLSLDGGAISIQFTQRPDAGADHDHSQEMYGAVAIFEEGSVIF